MVLRALMTDAENLHAQAKAKRDDAVRAAQLASGDIKSGRPGQAIKDSGRAASFYKEADRLDHIATQKEQEANAINRQIDDLDRQIKELEHRKAQLLQ